MNCSSPINGDFIWEASFAPLWHPVVKIRHNALHDSYVLICKAFSCVALFNFNLSLNSKHFVLYSLDLSHQDHSETSEDPEVEVTIEGKHWVFNWLGSWHRNYHIVVESE